MGIFGAASTLEDNGHWQKGHRGYCSIKLQQTALVLFPKRIKRRREKQGPSLSFFAPVMPPHPLEWRSRSRWQRGRREGRGETFQRFMRARDVSATDTRGRGGGGGGEGGGITHGGGGGGSWRRDTWKIRKRERGFRSLREGSVLYSLSLSLLFLLCCRRGEEGGRASILTRKRVCWRGANTAANIRGRRHKCRERGIALALQVGANSGKIGFFP